MSVAQSDVLSPKSHTCHTCPCPAVAAATPRETGPRETGNVCYVIQRARSPACSVGAALGCSDLQVGLSPLTVSLPTRPLMHNSHPPLLHHRNHLRRPIAHVSPLFKSHTLQANDSDFPRAQLNCHLNVRSCRGFLPTGVFK